MIKMLMAFIVTILLIAIAIMGLMAIGALLLFCKTLFDEIRHR